MFERLVKEVNNLSEDRKREVLIKRKVDGKTEYTSVVKGSGNYPAYCEWSEELKPLIEKKHKFRRPPNHLGVGLMKDKEKVNQQAEEENWEIINR